MEQMTKHQLILLVLLVSFVTALVTGIVMATLISQNPPPLTQTVQRVVERSHGVELPQPLKKDEAAELELRALSRDILIEDIVRRVSPAVVSVVATKDIPIIERYFVSPFPENDAFGKTFPDIKVPQYRQNGTQKQQISSGSGFLVTADGFLITNRHVVEDIAAEYSIIMNDGKKLQAKVLARDPLHDMAVLKIDGISGGHPFIPLGDSEIVKIGHTAIAIGNALGEFQNTVSIGVISGLRRNVIAAEGSGGAVEELSEVMQTDAAINPGNSGGPLLNLKGEVVGLNTAVAKEAENIGFSIPINQIKRGLEDVKATGKIIYPIMGVRYLTVNPDVKEKNKLSVDYGALLVKGPNGEDAVLPNSPADKAGIKEGDVVLTFGGVRVNKDNSLNRLIQSHRVGDKVTVKISRAMPTGKQAGVELKLVVTLEERKEF